MKQVAVFGGSFAPVHRGHISVATALIEKGLADEVWLVPCRLNPLKAEMPMADVDRLQALRKAAGIYNAVKKAELLKVNEVELSMPSPSYTIDTLRKLQELYPKMQFRVVMGADSYLQFHRWKSHEEILKDFAPIVYPRPGFEVSAPEPGWTLLSGVETFDISSTALRRSGNLKQAAKEELEKIKELVESKVIEG
ncbi:MAG: nicotinate-nicotinamide nucleotide adenylyltransferase [Muribaculaceae bacterium]|nr:nicotinate-nicotinamide nucleotide adenylyltransferase [Muribaculaceae bacterium]